MTTRLRLAFFADPTETHTQRWARFFVARGHDVAVIVRHDRPVPPDDPNGPSIIRIEPPGRSRQPARAVDMIRRLRRAVRRVDPHVVHAHYLTAQGWLAWASGFRPYAITVWGSDVYLDLAGHKARALGRLALRGAALVTADSAHLARAAVSAGARASRTEVIQFGVDTRVFAPGDAADLRHRLAPAGGRIVLSPRTLLPLYRHELVVDAMARLPDDLVMVVSARGAQPEAVRQLQNAAARAGVADRLVIVPEIPHGEMPHYLNAADVVVSVPISDGTPVTLLEAMACGRPTVVGDLPSLREWYSGGRDDLVVRDPDAASIAAAIGRALDLPDEARDDLLRRGREEVMSRADHARNMLAVEARYLELARST